jgi:hypothetical protein
MGRADTLLSPEGILQFALTGVADGAVPPPAEDDVEPTLAATQQLRSVIACLRGCR